MANVKVHLSAIILTLCVAGAAVADPISRFDRDQAPMKKWSDANSLVRSSMSSASAKGAWAKFNNRVVQGDAEPVLLVVTDDDATVSITNFTELPKRAAVVFVSLQSDSETEEEVEVLAANVLKVRLSAESLHAQLQASHNSRGIYGLHVFGQRGTLVWSSPETAPELVEEAIIVVKTLSVAADLRRARRSAEQRGQQVLSSKVIRLVASSVRGTVKLADEVHVGNRAILLNVWATWCKHCERELSTFEGVQTHHAGAIQYIGLLTDALDPQINDKVAKLSPASLRRFQFGLADLRYVAPIFPSVKARHVSSLRVPLTALIAPDGRILFSVVGDVLQEPGALDGLQSALRDFSNARHKESR